MSKKKDKKLLSEFEVTTKVDESGLLASFQANGVDAKDILLIIAESCGRILDEQEAVNYVEFTVTGGPDKRPKYIVTVQRHDHPTPHELRRIAEEGRDALLSIGAQS